MFQKILIANRGEIACRILKTARRLGIQTVAIYSEADRNAVHVKQADEAFYVGPSPARDSYLNIDAIIQIAQQTNVEAIHPGYGFLSENPAFARACLTANIVFIGPSVEALEVMGSKQLAKQLLEATDVPLTPGYHGKEQTNTVLLAEAKRLGFPVLLKAASGGGGKGMRAVEHADTFLVALDAARRESRAYFADDTMLIEKLIVSPRHIEIQVMADHHGQVVHLFERDCSIQRRHQKIIEEAPATQLSDALRQQLAAAAIQVATAIQYRGAGTVEFLLTQDEQFYFMEMNTRLQVEHPVTEMITGLDLVEWQLRIAANEPLPKKQNEIHAIGHAIECRVCAEDPSQDFIPSTGKIRVIATPNGEHVRIDTGMVTGDILSMYYDPMIAKLIVWGETRAAARQSLKQALSHYIVGGIKTNLPFLQTVIDHPTFIAGTHTTDFLERTQLTTADTNLLLRLSMAAAIDYLTMNRAMDTLEKDTLGFQLSQKPHWLARYLLAGVNYDLIISPNQQTELTITCTQLSTEPKTYLIEQQNNRLSLDDGQQHHTIYFEYNDKIITLYVASQPVEITCIHRQIITHSKQQTTHALTAPMPATVVAVLKNTGDKVNVGECLMILEAMKMEHTIHAPSDGYVELFYQVGEQVLEGVELASIQPNHTESKHHAQTK